MNEVKLIERYERASAVHIDLVDMDASAIAGYYLDKYAGDPIGALLVDMNQLVVPDTVGRSAKVILAAVLDKSKIR